jgi:hypothetical protein
MKYTLSELRNGTGFDRGATFVDTSTAKELLDVLIRLTAFAVIYSDITVGHKGQALVDEAQRVIAHYGDGL